MVEQKDRDFLTEQSEVISPAVRACTKVLHALTPHQRLDVIESLGLFYLPDGNYHDKVDPSAFHAKPEGGA